MRLQPTQEPEGMILNQPFEHNTRQGDLYTTSARQVFDHSHALGMARIYIGSKDNWIILQENKP